jgi:small subunit ribosomal protein S17
MTEEEKNEQTEETPEGTSEETPAEEPQAEEAQPEEASPEEEAQAEEEAPAEQPAADGDGSPADEGPDEMEGLDWKARRRLERSRRSAEAGPLVSPEERANARREARRQVAGRRSAYRAKRRGKQDAGTGTPPAERRSAGRKTRQGRVVSSKPDKTITVEIEDARRHPQYEKIVRRSRKLHAHDARNEAGEGDLVRVMETRPLSRTKRWRLVEIVEKAK